jgi:UDP:flavonoid glycosyltransferase YjiC (YdhE family)
VRILFATLPAYGHVYPLLPLALACRDAGHEVVVATGPPFLDHLPLPTVPGQPPTDTLDGLVAETRRRHPEATGFELSLALFADVAAGRVIPALLAAGKQFRPDLVVYEGMNSGAGVAANVLGVPAATFAIGLAPFVYGVLHPATVTHQEQAWRERGLTPPAGPLLAAALISPVPPSLVRDGPGLDAPRVPVRSVAYNDPAAVTPEWLSEPQGRPRVYVTLGTVSFGAVEVLRRALDDLAGLDVDVLVSVGPDGDPRALGEVGERVRTERFVAQARVLPQVDLVVHHGGTGTVLGALEAGRPQLLLPQGADQFLNAELIPAVGAGRALPNDAQTPGAIADQVVALLGDSTEAATARRIQAEMAAMPAPVEVVSDLVALVG